MTEPLSPAPPAPPPPPAPQAAPPAPPPAAWAAPPAGWTAAPPPPPGPVLKKPGVAGLLSVFPGVGHLYLGLYQRAAIFFVVWVAIITITNHGGGSPLGLLIPFWWLFVLIDAVRQAKAINATGVPESNLATFEKEFKPAGNLGFGIFLLLVGVFFLLDRWVKIDLSFLADNWMLIPIAFGAWLIWAHFKGQKKAEPDVTGV
jgi:hypothetical protein